jgi:hypothetical protein
VITITATDAVGSTGSAVLTVTYNSVPTVTITQPTSAGAYTTTNGVINLAGNASDLTGIASVIWSNNQGSGGSCSGTTSWSANGIALKAGKNVITITAADTNGNIGSAVLTVTYNAIPTLSVSTGGGLVSSGYVGGPFSASSVTYTLQNQGVSSLKWTASKKQSWVSLSSTSGTLAGGASTTVTVSINSGAKSLTAGSYSDTVSFTNSTNGNGDTTRSVSLTVNPAMTVSSTGGLASTGYAGGPFTPSSVTYTLQNPGGSPLKWTASKKQSWISLSSSNGTIAGGASITVTVSINSGAKSLTAGSYTDTISFASPSGGNTTRGVSLTVSPALSVSPTAGIVSSGPAGGPFTPSSAIYTLHNLGGASLKWTASKTQSWISLSSSGGSLAGGASTTVTVSFNLAADKLAEGDYSDTIKFTDSTNPKAVTSRGMTLSVEAK